MIYEFLFLVTFCSRDSFRLYIETNGKIEQLLITFATIVVETWNQRCLKGLGLLITVVCHLCVYNVRCRRYSRKMQVPEVDHGPTCYIDNFSVLAHRTMILVSFDAVRLADSGEGSYARLRARRRSQSRFSGGADSPYLIHRNLVIYYQRITWCRMERFYWSAYPALQLAKKMCKESRDQE